MFTSGTGGWEAIEAGPAVVPFNDGNGFLFFCLVGVGPDDAGVDTTQNFLLWWLGFSLNSGVELVPVLGSKRLLGSGSGS